MRRRNFIATLPIAAAGPAIAQDGPRPGRPGEARADEADPWVRLEAKPVTALGAAPSRNVLLMGSGTVTSFGEAPSGVTRLVRVGAEVVLSHDRTRLALPNNGQNLLATAGDTFVAVSMGGGNWVVASYQPATVFAKVDRRPSHGAMPYRFSIGDAAGAPDLAVDGGTDRTKVLMKSVMFNDPGDTPEIGLVLAGGTPASPRAWSAPYPGAFIYGWPIDRTGSAVADMSVQGDSSFLGRNAQITFAMTQDPTPRARGGALVFGVCPNNGQVPLDRGWFSERGNLVLSGRAYEATGLPMPWNPNPFPVQEQYHPVHGLNWYDYPGPAVLSVVATDAADNGAISIRKFGDMGSGFDLDVRFASGELQLNTVAGGHKTPRWGWDAQGNQVPIAPRGVDLGSPSRPVRTVHADSLDVRRGARGAAAVFHSERPGDEGVVTLRAGRGGEAFNFLKAVAVREGAEELAARIDGTGSAALAGAVLGQGRGAGAFMEWADGNPEAEDRAGWSVVLEGRKIRRAGPLDPPSAIVGVVAVRPNVAADAAWSHWSGKYLTDDFGRPVTRPVEHLRWVQPVIETREVERTRTVKELVRRPARVQVEVAEETPRLELVGDRWIRRMVQVRRVASRPAVETVLVHGEDGAPLTNDCGEPATAEIPVFEDAEVERTERYTEPAEVEIGRVEHVYPVHAVPEGVTAPPHAERFVVHEKVLNPAFDPAAAYRPRGARPEWDVVTFSGPELVRKGERTGDRWILMREVSSAVEEWLVR